jgi:hypothetical protein
MAKTKKVHNEETDPKDLEMLNLAIEKVAKARDVLNKILDEKLEENNMYYYTSKKNIGSRTIQELKYDRDKMNIETLIKNIKKMSD